MNRYSRQTAYIFTVEIFNMKKKLFSVALVVIIFSAFAYWAQKSMPRSASADFFAMDTYMSVTAHGKDSEKTVQEVKQAIEALDESLSVTKKDSVVYRLNEIKSADLTPDTDLLIEKSLKIKKQTAGAFDICIYPIMKEWGFTDKNFKVPDPETLSRLCDELKNSDINIDRENMKISLSENAAIDFGGIAKGYASEKARDIICQNGINSAIVNLGGNVYALGHKSDGNNWKVAIKSPFDSEKKLGIVSVHDKAVITSGGYERYFEKDSVRYHHIIDPFTGYPADNGIVSVTIISGDPTLADALSTALYVMGKEKATDFWIKNSGLFDFVICDETQNLYVTEGVADVFTSELRYEIIKK